MIFDGTNHPSAETLVADGLAGGLLYCGTPSSGKDVTAAQYADYKAHNLLVLLAYEHATNDIAGGAAAGQLHAAALLADARAKDISFTEPALPAVDEHVTAANLPLTVKYQTGFRNAMKAGGWQGPIGVYGFSEVLVACHDAGCADWYMGAGNRSTMPAYTNVWQDNTGTIQVGGAVDDKDWVLIPLPTEDDDMATIKQADWDALIWRVAAITGGLAAVGGGPTKGEAVGLVTKVNALTGALSADEVALIAAIKAQPTGGQVDVDDLATRLSATLGPDVAQALGAKLVA